MRRYALPARRSWRAWLRPAGLAVASSIVFGLLAAGAGACRSGVRPGSGVATRGRGPAFGSSGRLQPRQKARPRHRQRGQRRCVDPAWYRHRCLRSPDVGARRRLSARARRRRPESRRKAGYRRREHRFRRPPCPARQRPRRLRQAGAPIPLADAPWFVTLGDVNRDRKVDAVISHVGSVVGEDFVPSQHVWSSSATVPAASHKLRAHRSPSG